MSTTVSKCLPADDESKLHFYRWDEYGLPAEHINFMTGVEPPQEHFHYFPDCMHDTIQQLLDQKRSAILARQVMDQLAGRAERIQLNEPAEELTDDQRRKQAIVDRMRKKLLAKKNDAPTNK